MADDGITSAMYPTRNRSSKRKDIPRPMKLILKAIRFSYEAHDGQFRKYTESVPYWEHCKNVAHLVEQRIGENPLREEAICAAYLHDTVEDTSITLDDIRREFGDEVCQFVKELTNKYTAEDYPCYSRKHRKELECERLMTVSSQAKLIKLCDIIDNTRTIVEQNPKFAIAYLREKADMLEAMGFGK